MPVTLMESFLLDLCNDLASFLAQRAGVYPEGKSGIVSMATGKEVEKGGGIDVLYVSRLIID